jgi:AbrB family looped-hinge helix DNA binding protein
MFNERKGVRLETNAVKVRLSKYNQYSVTIPKGLAKAMQLKKGSILKFDYEDGKIIIFPVE